MVKQYICIYSIICIICSLFFSPVYAATQKLPSSLSPLETTLTKKASRSYITLSPTVTLLQEKASDTTHSYLMVKDYLASTRAIIDNTGVVTENITYYPYGTVVQNNATDSSGQSITDKYFTGHRQLDTTVSLIHAGARFYSPVLATFIQADMVEGPNRYAYAANNPIMFNDPSGTTLGTAITNAANEAVITQDAMSGNRIQNLKTNISNKFWNLAHKASYNLKIALGIYKINIPWLPKTVRQWEPQILKWSKEYNIDPEFTAIIMTIESGGYNSPANASDAYGLMQVTGDTAATIANNLGIEIYDMMDPEDNINFGTWYISALKNGGFAYPSIKDDPDWLYSMTNIGMAYNGGPGGRGLDIDEKALQCGGECAQTYPYVFNTETNEWTDPYQVDRYGCWVKGMWSERHNYTSSTYNAWYFSGGNNLINKALEQMLVQ